jgi:tRNA modification GTPase
VDTIAAISTPPGTGGVSVVRLSGPCALEIGDRIMRLRRGRTLSGLPGWSVALGDVIDPDDGTPVDEAIAVVMRGPRSYTGEDVVEIQCHGGRLVTEKILALALANGAGAAGAGEFTRRAFLSGRITLEEAEAVLDLVNAPSERSLREAGRRLKGELGFKIRAWELRLFGVLAALQGGADFPEDIGDQMAGAMKDLKVLHEEARDLLKRAPLGLALACGIEVCLVGRPNSGKSSLFNALLGQDRAIVTVVPGTTRDVLREKTEWAGLPVVLLDTAGLRETSEVVEAIGVERATMAAAEAGVILYVVDDTVGLAEEDGDWISRWEDRKLLVVVTKVDLGAGQVIPSEVERLSGGNWLRTSSITGEGLEQVKEQVTGWFSRGGLLEGAVPGSARQVDCLRRAVKAMEQAIGQSEDGWTEDVVVLSLEEAARSFAELTGKNVSEATLEQVFSKFCVGK